MTETVSINWLLMLSHFLWIFGVAVVIAMAALRRLSKPSLWLGGGLIAAGILLTFFILPSGRLIVEKVEHADAGSQLPSIENLRFVPPSELKLDPLNAAHSINKKKMQNNTLVLFWDGFIKSPYFRFPAGKYKWQFNARGTKVKDTFSKLKVEFESPDSQGYLLTGAHKYLELSGKMKNYDLIFSLSKDTIGRVRITFYNDLHLEGTLKGRDVFIKDVSIQPVRTDL